MNSVKSDTNKWKKNTFFILAAIGGAVGLGNLWRFPYMVYENGGGAFFIPYIVCLLLVGLPLVIFEVSLGKWGDGSIVSSFHKKNKTTSWIGWWVLINSMVIVFYYAIVLSWSLEYVFFSASETWGNDPASFFTNEVISITSQPFQFGPFNFKALFALLAIWISVFYIVKAGTKRISRVLLVTVPIPFLMLIVLSIRALTSEGGFDGFNYFIKPDFSGIGNISVWAAAASQIILSLGLGMGQLVAYSSKRKDNKGTIKSSMSILGFDFLFSLLAGITVFSTLGVLANNQGVEVAELDNIQGIFLAFVSYPAAISQLPLAAIWGMIFFTMLVLLGLDSVFAVIEANLVGFEEMSMKFSKTRLSLIICSVGFIGGVFFLFGNGLYWLDIIDHWVAYYAILSIVVLQGIILGFSKSLQKFIGLFISNLRYLTIFKIWVSILIPLSLLVFIINEIIGEFSDVYGGYPLKAVIIGGWGVFFLAIIVSIFLGRLYNKKKI